MHVFITVPSNLHTLKMAKEVKELQAKYGDDVDIVFKLFRPIYGLPCSGRLWEKYLDRVMKRLGWQTIPSMPQSWFKVFDSSSSKKTVASAFVDDLLCGGPHQDRAWKEISSAITITAPETVGRLLGVDHNFVKVGKTWTMTTSMIDYLVAACSRCEKLIAPTKLRRVGSPWLEVPKSMLDESNSGRGRLADQSASLLMTLMYVARMSRPDIITVVTKLARSIVNWSIANDKQLIHLHGYILGSINSTLDMQVTEGADVSLLAYMDSDLGGSVDCPHSTSGGCIQLASAGASDSPTTALLSWWSKKQQSTSTSTMEAELVAWSLCVKSHSTPCQGIWSWLMDREIIIKHHEDNESAILTIHTGFTAQDRFLAKHQRLNLGMLHEMHLDPAFPVIQIETALQNADMFTKPLARQALRLNCERIGMIITET
jgi:hypothetical protein